ncbi:MAG: hypothetical protein IJT40_03675, partial [Firmicutes bacterium]|nr:hypothetical protein [Bacillota bacterium]
FIAMDDNNIRVSADEATKEVSYHCQCCNEKVILKKGGHNRAHFAHRVNTNCKYDAKNSMSPWHIRMQEYFPVNQREVLFTDELTGEKHIADVFVPDSNTVIEFQHSAIKDDEFLARTVFHVQNGRRIVWVFDEAAKSPVEGDLGRLRPDDLWGGSFPYRGRDFRWQRQPRKCIQKGPEILYNHNWENYAVFIYSGVEDGDYLHRIIGQECSYEYVTLSVHTILMSKDMDVEDFFRSEQYWLDQPDWKPIMDRHRAAQAEQKRIREEQQHRATNLAFDMLLHSGTRRGRFRF